MIKSESSLKKYLSQLEEVIHINEEQKYSILNEISAKAFQIDPDFTIYWANKTALEDNPDSVGQFCHMVFYNREEPCNGCPCLKTNINGCTSRSEVIQTKLSEGLNHHYWDIRAIPIKERQNNITGFFVIENNITKEKEKDDSARLQHEQLIQADKLISLGILVSGVAHEINNPNNSIMLNVSLLQKAWASIMPILDEYYREKGNLYLAGVNYEKMQKKLPELLIATLDCSKRIQQIVKNLKNYSGKDSISLKTEIDIEAVARSAIHLVENLIKKSTHHFKVVYERNLPRIKGNFQNLEQVMINIIQNACQAIKIPLHGIFLSITYDQKRQQVVIALRDEGVGISTENIKYITEPFFTTKRSAGGTGLGLYVSSKIIMDHGGTMRFFSERNKGTTVEIRLPALEVISLKKIKNI